MRYWRFFVVFLTLLLAITALFCWREESKTADSFHVEVSFGGKTEVIDLWQSGDGTDYVFLPSYASLDRTCIRTGRGNDLSLNSVPLANGMSCDVFTLDTRYALTDGKTELGSVVFTRSENVPAVYIDVNSGSMDYIHEDQNNREAGSVRVYRSDGTLDYAGRMKSMSGRGQSTWSAEKKPYNISLSVAADLLDMGQAKNWVLLANAFDCSHLRNQIVLTASAAVGPPFTPECRWVELYLNGEYAGLYLLCERNEVDPQRVNIAREGSFLVSKDWEWRFEEKGQTYFTTQANAALRVYYTTQTMEELTRDWQSAENAILAEDGIDPVTGKSWQELIDLNSWARRYLVEEVFGNVDAAARSQAFFRDGWNGKICAGPVWDYDLTLGNTYAWSKPVPNMLYGHIAGIWGTPWYAALYQKPAFYDRVVQLYETEFRPELERLLETGIDNMAAEVEVAADRNNLRWGAGNAGEETEAIRTYLAARMEFLDELWMENVPYCEVSVCVEDGVKLCYAVRQGDSLPELPEYENYGDVVYDGWFDSETGESFDLTQPILTDTSIFLRYSRVTPEETEAEWVDAETTEPQQEDRNTGWRDVIAGIPWISLLKLVPLAVFFGIFACVAVTDIRRNKREGRT